MNGSNRVGAHLARWTALAVFSFGLILAVLGVRVAPKPVFAQTEASVAAAQKLAASALPAYFDWHDLPKPTPSAHAVTVAEILPAVDAAGGVPSAPVRLIAAWFGGTREGAADVSLYQSTWGADQKWGVAREMLSRGNAERQLGRNIRKLGNPLFVADAGRLQLFFVSVSYGGWAGSAINRSVSVDGGEHWSAAQRMITSPFFNLSTLVRNPGSHYADGSLGLPVYHEFINKHGEWLRLDSEGRVLGKSRMAMPRPTLQPAVVPLSAEHAVAALRDAGPGPNQIQWSETRDGGQSWVQQSARAVPNPNSAAAMIGLRDGSLLMACNPIAGNRNQLSLLRSTDQGDTWALVRVIEQSPDDREEFSYPALLQDHSGAIHLLYTWKRRGIRHASFTEAWLNNPGNPIVPAVPQ